MFHINISQLKITKVNIIENFEKENSRITSEFARILKRKEIGGGGEGTFFIVHFVYLNGPPIVALTLKVSNKYNCCLLKMVKTES